MIGFGPKLDLPKKTSDAKHTLPFRAKRLGVVSFYRPGAISEAVFGGRGKYPTVGALTVHGGTITAGKETRLDGLDDEVRRLEKVNGLEELSFPRVEGLACHSETGRREGNRDGDVEVETGRDTPPVKGLFEVGGDGSRGRNRNGTNHSEGECVTAFGKDIEFA